MKHANREIEGDLKNGVTNEDTVEIKESIEHNGKEEWIVLNGIEWYWS